MTGNKKIDVRFALAIHLNLVINGALNETLSKKTVNNHRNGNHEVVLCCWFVFLLVLITLANIADYNINTCEPTKMRESFSRKTFADQLILWLEDFWIWNHVEDFRFHFKPKKPSKKRLKILDLTKYTHIHRAHYQWYYMQVFSCLEMSNFHYSVVPTLYFTQLFLRL